MIQIPRYLYRFSCFGFATLLLPALLFTSLNSAHALSITDAAVEVRNDFVIEPAKTEVFLKPGEQTTRTLSVVNRTDREQTFTIEIEDFTGSKDPTKVVALLGSDRGPYSLKDYLQPETRSFKLKSKQRAVFSVVIDIPADAEPGGLYGSVLVSSSPSSLDEDSLDNTARTISRIGALYFVRVAGKVKEDAQLTDFRLVDNKSIYEKGPVNFELLFENNSSVHLTPGGKVEIKNMLGRKVTDLDVVPFFSLPDSLRSAQVSWDSGFAFGRYTATAEINRGYRESTDQTDTMSVAFWVLPWKILVALLVAIVVVVIILRKLLRGFEIKRKR
jgi:hypothetical protein